MKYVIKHINFLIATYWILKKYIYVCDMTFGPIGNFYRVT